ncbi:MAG TPA: hypothetical protein VHU43_06175 [Steroidobacteraceae bacterium]|nr:hypothetical protein [Steroidobacteraceae bacterium]
MRSIIEPLWQEVSSLWSTVEFAFYDPSKGEAELAQEVLAVNPTAAAAPSDTGPVAHAGWFEQCW